MFTRKLNKHGPKGTTIEINKNIDSEFYHNMFCRPGGAFDMTEAKMPWLRGREFKIQQDSSTMIVLSTNSSGTAWY